MPKVKSEILLWARENSLLSKEVAARKLNIKDSKKMSGVEKLTAIETGNIEPSRSLLLRMSKQYHLPLLTFYLDRPPKIGDRGEDFRTLPDSFEEIENINVDILIRDIKARQSTIRETLIDADEEVHLEFVGKHKIEDGIEKVVQTINKVLDINLEEYWSKPNYKEAFRFLRQIVESKGIYVLLKGNLGSYHSNIPVNVFRGFALSDDIAPFIVINDQDTEAAWSFTLIHEMVHLVLGRTGVSGKYFDRGIEKFCNDAASEFLLPTPEFEKFRLSNLSFDNIKKEISAYAKSRRLSSTHIAYRLYRQGDISISVWNDLRDFYEEKWRETREANQNKYKQKDSGPGYYMLKKYKLGKLVGLVERLTYSGALTTTKAGMLLDVKPLKVHRLFQT